MKDPLLAEWRCFATHGVSNWPLRRRRVVVAWWNTANSVDREREGDRKRLPADCTAAGSLSYFLVQ